MQQDDIRTVKELLKQQSTYNSLKPYKEKVMQGDNNMMASLAKIIFQVLDAGEPMQRLMAMRLAKETVELQNYQYIRIFADNALPAMQQIASFKSDDKSDARGKFLFAEQPTKEQSQVGNSLFRLVMDCIQTWAVWYPQDPLTGKDSPYKVLYDKLIREEVSFPKLSYYKQEDLKKKVENQSEIVQMKSQQSKILEKVSAKTKANSLLENIVAEQGLMGDILTGEGGPDEVNMLQECVENLKNYKDESEELLLEIMDDEFDGKDQLMETMLLKQDFIEGFTQDFSKFMSQKLTFKQLQQRQLPHCSSTPNPDETPNPDVDKIKQEQEKELQEKIRQQKEEEQRREKQIQEQQARERFIKEKQEKERQERERQERERQERERQERQERERQEREKQERERQERERQEREKQDQQRMEREKQDQQRMEREKKERESKMRQDQERARLLQQKEEEDKAFEEDRYKVQQLLERKKTKEQRGRVNKFAGENDWYEQAMEDEGVIQRSNNLNTSASQPKRNVSRVKLSQVDEESSYQNKHLNFSVDHDLQSGKRRASFVDIQQQQQQLQLQQNDAANLKQIGAPGMEQLLDVNLLKEQLKQRDERMNHLLQENEELRSELKRARQDQFKMKTEMSSRMDQIQQEKNEVRMELIEKISEVSHLFQHQKEETTTLGELVKENRKLRQESLEKEEAIKKLEEKLRKPKIFNQGMNQSQLKNDSLLNSQLMASQDFFINSRLFVKNTKHKKQAQLTQYYKDLIFPYTDAHQFYRDRIQKAMKGRLVRSEQILGQMLNQKNQDNLRGCILYGKHRLFISKQFEVGAYLEQISSDSVIKLHLYFINHRKADMVQIQVTHQLTFGVGPLASNYMIPPNQQAKQEITFQLRDYDAFTTQNSQVQLRDATHDLQLPITILAFVQPLKLKLADYKKFWKRVQPQLYKSESIASPRVEEDELRHYWSHLIELNPHKRDDYTAGIDEIKYGGLWKVGSARLLVRFTLKPIQEVVVQVAKLDGNRDQYLIELVINSLVFIFQ